MSPRRVTTAVLLLGLGCSPGESVVGGVPFDATVATDALADVMDVRVAVDVPPPECRTDGECADLVDCTVDLCRDGRCRHDPTAALCPTGSACEALRGCRPVRACHDNAACSDDDPCTLAERCDNDHAVCVFDELPAETPCGSAGSGRSCRGGACQCPADRASTCGDRCVDIRSDPDHCGDCATVCGAGSWCRDGACVCPASQIYCPGVGCVDTAVDTANCGACNHGCATGDAGRESCIQGMCLAPCAVGTHRCGTACAADASPASCGSSCLPCPASPHGTAACAAGRCSLDCAAGYHACGGACVELASLAGCGAACAVCIRPTHGAVACEAGACAVTCSAGYHACHDDCVADTSPLSCGSSCAPCTVPPHGAAACTAGACDVTCDAGFRACNGTCSDGTSPLACGASCTRCAAPDYGVATCTSGACGFTCNVGFHRCGAACLADASPLACGTSCSPCPVPAHSVASCALGVCGFTCALGFRSTATDCVELPRPLAPASLATVTVRRPTLRWRLPTGAVGASVDLCRDRACATPIETLTVTGASATPTHDLPAGAVFWRVHVGVDTSATWAFVVGALSAPVEAAWGELPDVNGDGLGDVLVTAPESRACLFLGAAGGLSDSPTTLLAPPTGAGGFGAAIAAGDVNGDGFADAVVVATNSGGRGRAYVYAGGPGGLGAMPMAALASPDPVGDGFGESVAVAGDVDGDGYNDVLVGAPNAAVAGRAYLYRGAAGGPEATPSVVLMGPTDAMSRFGQAVAGAGDLDADGLADLIVGADGVASDAGRAYLFHGARAGFGAASWAVLQSPGGGSLGNAVAGAGDVNGDGYPDVAVGAPGTDFAGAVLVFGGSATGVGASPVLTLRPPNGTSSAFGSAVASAGDFDGDGYGDLAVAAPGLSPSGGVHLFLGSATGLPAAPATTWGGAVSGTGFGRSVSSGRDVDGDGRSELVFGVEYANSFSGVAFVVRGGALANVPYALTTPPSAGGYFGHALASR